MEFQFKIILHDGWTGHEALQFLADAVKAYWPTDPEEKGLKRVLHPQLTKLSQDAYFDDLKKEAPKPHPHGELEVVDVYVEDVVAMMNAPRHRDCVTIVEADSPAGEPTRYYVVRAGDNPENY